MQHRVAPSAGDVNVEQWAALDEDEPGELVDGRIEEEEVPSFAHEIVVSFLLALLRSWIGPAGGFALASEAKIAITERRGRKADVIVFLPGRPLPRRRATLSRFAPDIVVEVVTPTPRDGRRDRVEKRADYAAIGVGQYWLVDPQLRTVEILRRGPRGGFGDALAVSAGRHPVPGCEGLVLDVDALWRELDAWPDEEPQRGRSRRARPRRPAASR